MKNCGSVLKKWLIIGFSTILTTQIAGFFLVADLLQRKIIHYYLNTNEVLEQIHNVTIDHGKVYKK